MNEVTVIILDQNAPNPFAEDTDIRYVIPETVKKADIIIYNKSGIVLKSVDVKTKGEGTLHIYAADLSSGLYVYSLIVDGKVMETKTMAKAK